MCSETDFIQEKVKFHSTSEIPKSSSFCCCPRDPYLTTTKEHEKSISETLHNEIKCVLSVKESNCNEKKDPNFHICLQSEPRGLNPPPIPYSQYDCKVAIFYNFPLGRRQKLLGGFFFAEGAFTPPFRLATLGKMIFR